MSPGSIAVDDEETTWVRRCDFPQPADKCGVIGVDTRIRKDPRALRRMGRDFTRKGRARQQDPCL
jgi:hypothetical protein